MGPKGLQTFDRQMYSVIGAGLGGHFGAILGDHGASGAICEVPWGASGFGFRGLGRLG